MKLKNILSVLCFLFIAVACSMEDDIMNDVDKEIQTSSEVYATLGVSLATDGIQTRSAEYGDEEEAIGGENTVTNCYVAVFEKESKRYLTSRLYQGGKEIISGSENQNLYNLGKSLVFKVSAKKEEHKDLLFVAVAHMNTVDYGETSSISKGIQNITDYSQLMNFVLAEDPTVLVKVGTLIIEAKDFETYMNISSSMIDEDGNALQGLTPIRIEVKQRAAAVMLESFKMERLNVKLDVTVESIQLLNMVTSTNVEGYDKNLSFEDSVIRTINETDQEGNIIHREDLFKERFYTYEYPVVKTTKTKLRIGYSYKLNGKVETGFSEITIKSPGEDGAAVEEVRANHLYKLNVMVKNGVVNVSIKCSTKDWVYSPDNDHNFEFTYSDK